MGWRRKEGLARQLLKAEPRLWRRTQRKGAPAKEENNIATEQGRTHAAFCDAAKTTRPANGQ
jgi:hypothetical protein